MPSQAAVRRTSNGHAGSIIGKHSSNPADEADVALESSGAGDDDEVQDTGSLLRTEFTLESSPPCTPTAAAAPEPALMFWGVQLKELSLAALTLQTSAQALLIRFSKSADADGNGPQYLSTSVVFMTEVVKVLASLCLVVHESQSLDAALEALKTNFMKDRCELIKACVPSLIYTIQNNLMFYSLEVLSAPMQQVLYQMKVVTTAGIGVLMLGKSLTHTQWVACFLLALGVALVQLPRDARELEHHGGNQFWGFIAVLAACCTSGFAGVWIQKMLQQTTASVWMRNVQLGFFGSIMSIIIAFMKDGETIANDGLFKGYNLRVVSVILMTAFGGLLCAVMLKYAGATHGCFSTAMSIILTGLVSTMLEGFTPDGFWVFGTLVVISASLLFALGLPARFKAGCGTFKRGSLTAP